MSSIQVIVEDMRVGADEEEQDLELGVQEDPQALRRALENLRANHERGIDLEMDEQGMRESFNEFMGGLGGLRELVDNLQRIQEVNPEESDESEPTLNEYGRQLRERLAYRERHTESPLYKMMGYFQRAGLAQYLIGLGMFIGGSVATGGLVMGLSVILTTPLVFYQLYIMNHKKIKKGIRWLKNKWNRTSFVEPCPICMENITDGITLNCNHQFCDGCITRWRQTRNNCPLCRSEIE